MPTRRPDNVQRGVLAEKIRARRLRRFDKDVRPEPAVDMVTRDAGFAVLLPEDATLHTTRRRLTRTRARRRDTCGG